MFINQSTGIAIVFIIWSIIVTFIDNILEPVLPGQGAVVPMRVIFKGAIGGIVASGLVGLFTGTAIFSVGYKLFPFRHEEKKTETEPI